MPYINRLKQAAQHMQTVLEMCTGLNPLDVKLVMYWTIATHMLPSLDLFPILTLNGVSGSGKSTVMQLIEPFAYNPIVMTAELCTIAGLRENMAAAHNGTLLIEEADDWKDGISTFENMLICRYSRVAGRSTMMVKKDHYSWGPETKLIFGATAAHRRAPYADSAAESRSVTIGVEKDKTRAYESLKSLGFINQEVSEMIKGLKFEGTLINNPNGISPRIFDTYKPIIMASVACGDDISPMLLSRLESHSKEFDWEASVEPKGLVVRAMINLVSISRSYDNVKFSAIRDWVWQNHRMPTNPRQIGVLLRQVGFTTKESHGITVAVPTPGALLRACRIVGYEDEELANELRKQIPGFPIEDDENR